MTVQNFSFIETLVVRNLFRYLIPSWKIVNGCFQQLTYTILKSRKM